VADNDVARIVVRVDPDLKEIIPDFFAFRHRDVRTVTELVAQGDFARIKVIGHNIKGAGGGYGFDAISEIGQRLERAAEQSAIADVHGCIRELADYLAQVEVRYD
jgi:HPt (histidine-containing phosphotransfer) domain-containing protein